MQNLEQLNLTENDFKLLVDGLDFLPNKDSAGEMMVDLIGAMMMKGEEEKARFESDMTNRKASKEAEKSLLKEEVKILQGKLLMLKRYLIENNIMKQSHEFIK